MSYHVAEFVAEFKLGDARRAAATATPRVRVVKKRKSKQEKIQERINLIKLRKSGGIDPKFAGFGYGEATVDMFHEQAAQEIEFIKAKAMVQPIVEG